MKEEAEKWIEKAKEDLDTAEIVKHLLEFKKSVRRKYGIEKIVFFGSRATGKYHKDSDIDLILISRLFEGKSSLSRPRGLYLHWKRESRYEARRKYNSFS